MSEAEFDLLLEAVKTAVASAPEDKMSAAHMGFGEPPKAANDNQLVFGFISTPEGSNAKR
jgi:hypothetical protein